MDTAITLGSFAFFTGLVGFFTWRLTRGHLDDSSDNYFLAGRSLSAGVIAGSLMLTNLSTEQLVGLNGDALRDGLSCIVWEVVASVAIVLMALCFLPFYLRTGIATVPQFFGERIGPSVRATTSLLFIAAYTLILLPVTLYSGARGLVGILDMKGLLGIESEFAAVAIAVVLIGSIGSVYAIFGGLKSVAVSDTLNGLGLLVGGFLISYYALMKVDPAGVVPAVQTLTSEHPEMFNSLGSNETKVPFATVFTGVLLINVFYWCTNQQIIQRTFAAKSLAEGQKGVLLAGFLKLFGPLILVLPGLIAFHLHQTGELTLPFKESAPDVLDSDRAYGMLVRFVLPSPLTGFFAAVLIGAVLSSFNSALNSTATLFSLGVYKGMFRPDASDVATIRVGKVFGTVIAIAAMAGAPFLLRQESIFQYLQGFRSVYAIPILSLVVASIWFQKIPAWAANLVIVLGGAGVVLHALGDQFEPALGFNLKAMTEAASVHQWHYNASVFVGTVGLLWAAAKFTPSTRVLPKRPAPPIDMTPWPLAKPAGCAIVATVFAIYIYFADVTVVDWLPWYAAGQ